MKSESELKPDIKNNVFYTSGLLDYNIDLVYRTESWLRQIDYVSLKESTPPSHINVHILRHTGKRGGVAAIVNSLLLCYLQSSKNMWQAIAVLKNKVLYKWTH